MLCSPARVAACRIFGVVRRVRAGSGGPSRPRPRTRPARTGELRFSGPFGPKCAVSVCTGESRPVVPYSEKVRSLAKNGVAQFLSTLMFTVMPTAASCDCTISASG